MSVTVVPAFCLNYTAARKKLVNFFRNLSSILNIYQRASKMRLSIKGRYPVLDTGSPSVDMGRRYRIGVRYDDIENECSSYKANHLLLITLRLLLFTAIVPGLKLILPHYENLF